MNQVSDKVLAAFQVEHRELLEGIRAFLDAPAGRGEDAVRRKLDEAFRFAHSLKGSARVCDLREIESVGHHMESLLARMREGVIQLDNSARDALSAALNVVEDWMTALADHRSPALQTEIDAAISKLGAACGTPGKVAGRTHPESVPVSKLADVPASFASATVAPTTENRSVLRVSSESLDRILGLTNDLAIECRRQAQLRPELDALTTGIEEWTDEWEKLRRLSSPAFHRSGVAPGSMRVSSYLESGEQRAQRLVRQASKARLRHQKSVAASNALCDQIQRHVRDARMVTAQSVFDGFRRMVRDLAQEENKEAELRVSGMEVLADRAVLDCLKDPIMHLLRNAVVHGIESPKERAERGKEPTGRIRLDLQTVGTRLFVRVSDDGRGIDYPQVERAARQRGWIADGDRSATERRDLERFLFRPGFTTRTSADRLSGRGFGLSVVDDAAVRLQGNVRLVTGQGPGAVIEVEVPSNLSSQRILTVACGETTICLPLHAVDCVRRIRLENIEKVEGSPVVVVNDEPLRLYSLRQLLRPAASDAESRLIGNPVPIVVLRAPSGRIAVAVDRFMDERGAVIKEIHGPAARLDWASGGVLLEDGGVALVLNTAKLVGQRERQAPIELRTDPQPEPRTPTILIVDDSFTTRTLERSILETHGYHICVAVDGLDALRQLRSEPVDLVVADVQMPNMDGFQLVESMKSDPRLTNLPVVLVTSMDDRTYRERGLALGADAYIVKQKFDHEALLATIRQLIARPTIGLPSMIRNDRRP